MKTLGILCRKQHFENSERFFLNASFVDRFSALPVLLHPILPGPHLNIEANQCDALLLPGGIDVSASFYHQDADEFSDYYDGFLDIEEFLLIDAFMQKKKPILGICRGMQMLQVYFHGSLEPHFDTISHQQDHLHIVQLAKKTYLRQLYTKELLVNSYHHQRVTEIAPELIVDAFCKDGTIEAFHHPIYPVLGIQWHPELEKNDRILPYFLSIIYDKITPFNPVNDTPEQNKHT